MQFSLSQPQQELRDSVVRFAREQLQDDVAQRDRDQEFPRELWNRCGTWRMQGLAVPAEQGGKGLDPLHTAVALEGLGYGCPDSGLVFSIAAQLLSCVVPIWKHGSPAQRSQLLPQLCDGRLVAVHGMTEPASGSDAFHMAMRAEPEGDGFRLQGVKTMATNGPVADLALVYAMTNAEKGYFGGVTAFLVEMQTAGLSVGANREKMGLRTVPFGELVFDNVYVPSTCVLGRVGGASGIFTESMDWERGLLPAVHVGTMQRLLDQAIEYARSRKQFGQAIGKFQAVSHRIADMKVRLEAARLLVYQAADRLESARSASLEASIAKLFTSESLVQSSLDAIRTFGAYGILTETQVERALRDSVASTIYSGTSDIQRNIVARWLGL